MNVPVKCSDRLPFMLFFYIFPIILIPILIYENVLFFTGIIFLLTFIYTYFVIKYYLIKKEKLLLSCEKERDDRGEEIHVYLVDKDYREYEACSKILDLLEGNETIEVIIKNRDIPIVSSDSALLPRWSYVDSITIG